jgi:tetratricopeptide (TPR) repeat protein
MRRLHLVVSAGLLMVGGWAVWGGVQAMRPPRAVGDVGGALAETPFGERALRDTQIVVWRKALAADPNGTLVLGQLAGLHMQRAREGGAWKDYLEAEALARRSLAGRLHRNGASAATLVAALVAQHRFLAADSVATALLAREPDVPEYRAILAEVAMERGDYARAEREFDRLWPARTHLSIAPRLARWHELRGEVGLARRLLEQAIADAERREDLPRETRAWFALRLGELERRAGRPRRAELAFTQGLRFEPSDPRLLGAMTRLALERGRYRESIEWGERALAFQPEPEVISLLAAAHRAHGDREEAARMDAAFDASIATRSGPFHRTWSLALLDRDERVAETLELAQSELRDRNDVYGSDLVAWALFKSGRVPEAADRMTQALRLGTRDPLLAAHKQAIDAALVARRTAVASTGR